MTSTESNRQIPGFDLLKFLMAFGIVAIHSELAQETSMVNETVGGNCAF